MRLLDLLRLLQGRRQPDGAPKAALGADWVAPEWAWAWPHNRRILYNRASADPEGQALVGAQEATSGGTRRSSKWTGLRRAGFHRRRRRLTGPPKDARGKDTISGVDPFIMQCRRQRPGSLRRNGLQDGPLPTHYEPQESVIQNPLYGQQCNPPRMEWMRRDNPYHQAVGRSASSPTC